MARQPSKRKKNAPDSKQKIKPTLTDELAERVVHMIRSEGYKPGDRLPAIMAMSRTFGVGHPSLREALRRLELVGIVEIKHGSGVYVGSDQDRLVVTNPNYGGEVSRKLMLDLIEARIPIESRTAKLASINATPAQRARLRELLERAAANLRNDELLNATNLEFHHEIAVASDNKVLAQLINALTSLFRNDQLRIMTIYGSREIDHQEHWSIFEAIDKRDPELAQRLMEEHLEGIRNVLLQWDPVKKPINGSL
ncbi:MAG: FadR/GntR family transcriptional regulator [Rhodothermales bacterium]